MLNLNNGKPCDLESHVKSHLVQLISKMFASLLIDFQTLKFNLIPVMQIEIILCLRITSWCHVIPEANIQATNCQRDWKPLAKNNHYTFQGRKISLDIEIFNSGGTSKTPQTAPKTDHYFQFHNFPVIAVNIPPVSQDHKMKG